MRDQQSHKDSPKNTVDHRDQASSGEKDLPPRVAHVYPLHVDQWVIMGGQNKVVLDLRDNLDIQMPNAVDATQTSIIFDSGLDGTFQADQAQKKREGNSSSANTKKAVPRCDICPIRAKATSVVETVLIKRLERLVASEVATDRAACKL